MTPRFTWRSRLVIALSFGALAASVIVACNSSDLVVGDDAKDTTLPTSDAQQGVDAAHDAAHPDDLDARTDVAPDGAPGPCAAPGSALICVATGTPCRTADTTGLWCPLAGMFCCVDPCPTLAPPPAGFCDGAAPTPTYDSSGCTIGYACAPVSCATAGGSCVGIAPSSCPAPHHFGDATKYSCGPGIGTGCCLP